MIALFPYVLMGTGIVSLDAQGVGQHAGALAEFSAAVEELCAAASPAVVQIEVRTRTEVTTENGRTAGYFAKQRSTGSGVIVDAHGYIVTNAHVVEGSREIDVSVADTSDPGRKDAHKHFVGTIGTDRETDSWS